MSTPNPTDFYSRYMINYFDNRANFPVPTAWQSIFGNPDSASVTHFSNDEETVEIDIIKKNGERLAPTVHRGQNSQAVDIPNVTEYEWTNVNRKWPLVEIVGHIKSTQLLHRLPGDSPYRQRTALDRNRQIARDIHFDHVRKSLRTWEYWARESVLQGQQSAIIGTSNTLLIYDFYRLPANTIAVPVAWDTGSADILKDIDDAITQAEVASGRTPDFMGVGGDAHRAFLSDLDILAKADNLRYELIRAGENFRPPAQFNRYIQNGWTALAQLMTPEGRKLWIFTNSRTFTNNSGATERWMPEDKAFLFSTQARFDRYFGPRDRLPVTPQEMQWYISISVFLCRYHQCRPK